MKVTLDTNLLVRMFVFDHPGQNLAVSNVLANAETIAIPTVALCEFVWVLKRLYRSSNLDLLTSIQELVDTAKVKIDRSAVEAGMAAMATGGDFADGVIAYEGQRLGGEVFVSFDQRAVKVLQARGVRAQLAE